ncbi:hypothetical protein CRENBAI_017711 [Crenichthys baileyi]|uniref:Uncharacterized protein n=1 Tax=Crenichthys baileyi TaxID=28760 RepID=A0AAV9R6H9_9TELE
MSAEVVPEEQSPDMDQQELLLLHASQDGEQVNAKKETDVTIFPSTVVHMRIEEDEEKHLFSQLHQHQTEDRDLPSSSSGDQIKAEIKEEDCGTADSSMNPDLNTHRDMSNYSETDGGSEEDDVKHHKSELKRLSDSETEDSEDDWKESRTPGSGRNTVRKSLSCSERGGKFANRRSLQSHMTCHSRLSSECSSNETCFREKKIMDSFTKVQMSSKHFNCVSVRSHPRRGEGSPRGTTQQPQCRSPRELQQRSHRPHKQPSKPEQIQPSSIQQVPIPRAATSPGPRWRSPSFWGGVRQTTPDQSWQSPNPRDPGPHDDPLADPSPQRPLSPSREGATYKEGHHLVQMSPPVQMSLPTRAVPRRNSPNPSASVVVSLGKTLHPHCLLMVVRGPGGADCMVASLLSVCPRAAMAAM